MILREMTLIEAADEGDGEFPLASFVYVEDVDDVVAAIGMRSFSMLSAVSTVGQNFANEMWLVWEG